MPKRSQSTKPNRIVLSVKHRRLNGVGFGGYIEGTSRRRGHAHILVDLDAIAYVAAMHGTKEFKRTFIETVAHEFMHALEDRFGLMFNEKRVEAAIRRGRKVIQKQMSDEEWDRHVLDAVYGSAEVAK
jgi:hypothetical protein